MAQANQEYKYYRQLAGTWKSNDGECVVVLTDTVKITAIYSSAVLEGNYGVIPTGPSVDIHPQGKMGMRMPGFMTYRYDPSEDIQLMLGDRSLKDGDRIVFNIDFAWHDDTDRLHLDLSNVITGEKLGFILCREAVSPTPLKECECLCDCGQVFTGKFCPNCGRAVEKEYTCQCGYRSKGAKFCPNCGRATGQFTLSDSAKEVNKKPEPTTPSVPENQEEKLGCWIWTTLF